MRPRRDRASLTRQRHLLVKGCGAGLGQTKELSEQGCVQALPDALISQHLGRSLSARRQHSRARRRGRRVAYAGSAARSARAGTVRPPPAVPRAALGLGRESGVVQLVRRRELDAQREHGRVERLFAVVRLRRVVPEAVDARARSRSVSDADAVAPAAACAAATRQPTTARQPRRLPARPRPFAGSLRVFGRCLLCRPLIPPLMLPYLRTRPSHHTRSLPLSVPRSPFVSRYTPSTRITLRLQPLYFFSCAIHTSALHAHCLRPLQRRWTRRSSRSAFAFAAPACHHAAPLPFALRLTAAAAQDPRADVSLSRSRSRLADSATRKRPSPDGDGGSVRRGSSCAL